MCVCVCLCVCVWEREREREREERSTVYCCTYFKETNKDESFHVPEICQHDFLSLISACETFSLLKRHCVSTPWTDLSTQADIGKLMFCPFVNTLTEKYASLYTSHFLLSILHDVHFSAPKNLFTDFSIQAQFALPPFWVASKQILLHD